MPKHILVSPLGFSPGAVSGVAFSLRRGAKNAQHETICYPVDEVITLGTNHNTVRESAGHLQEVLPPAGIHYRQEYIPQQELRQTNGSVATFVARMGQILEQVAGEENVVHVAITGGRAGMGSLAALAASLYGASHLWHFWVDPQIELGGYLFNRPQPFEMGYEFLNPPPEKCELVELPFIDLRPLHPMLWEYYRSNGESLPSTAAASGLNAFLTAEVSLADIFPAGATLRHKQQVDAIVQRQSQGEAELGYGPELVKILAEAGFTDENSAKRLRKILRSPVMKADDLLADGVDNPGENPFWHYLQSQQRKIEEAVQAGTHMISATRLREQMEAGFNLDDIQTLCFDLAVKYENLSGDTLTRKVIGLIEHVERHGMLPALIGTLAQNRPHVDWLEGAETVISPKRVTETDMFLLYGLQFWLIFRANLRAAEIG